MVTRFFLLVLPPGSSNLLSTAYVLNFPEVNRPECGVYHSPLPSPRLCMGRQIPVPPLCAFVACYMANFVLFILTKGNVYEEPPTATSSLLLLISSNICSTFIITLFPTIYTVKSRVVLKTYSRRIETSATNRISCLHQKQALIELAAGHKRSFMCGAYS